MADQPTLLKTIATELLDASEAALRDAGLDPVNRRFTEIGPVHAPIEFGGNCTSQLTCTIGPLSQSQVTSFVQGRSGKPSCALIWQCRFEIMLLRCHPMLPENALPKAADIDAQADLHYRDGWQLARALSNKWANKLLVPSYPFDCETTQWGQMKTVPPQGGIRGWALDLAVTVHDQYAPEAMTAL